MPPAVIRGGSLSEQLRKQLEPAAVRRHFDRAAASYEAASDLQQEVAAELLDRLAPVRIRPDRVVDLGCGTGGLTRELARMYRRAEVLGVDFAPAMLGRVRGRRLLGRRPLAVGADIMRLPLSDASVDLLVSNLAFQWIEDATALFAELRRVLRPDGVLMFSTFGPDTLGELRAAWRQVDQHDHVNRFADMHDIGDAMLAAGLRDPVMDVDHHCRGYADLPSLMRAIKTIGAANANRERRRGLTGRSALARLEQAYDARDESGHPQATWEVVYGHAWGAPIARAGSGDAREFHVPIAAIGRKGKGRDE